MFIKYFIVWNVCKELNFAVCDFANITSAKQLSHVLKYLEHVIVVKCQECHELLRKKNIDHINVPANYTDMLQPLNLSVNKSCKDEMKWHFQTWYT